MQMISRQVCVAAAAATLLSLAGAAHASLILNGSFEDNTASGNVWSPSNAQFNSIMSNVTAYGVREGIDIETVDSPYGQAPIDGNWKIAPASDLGGTSEEFSLTLAAPLVAGQSYDLSFYIERQVGLPFDGGSVDIGLSTSATSFGTYLMSATAPDSGWLLAGSSFVAPTAGEYLTVRVTNDKSSWVALDDFVLNVSAVPEPQSVALLLAGLGVVGLVARRRTRAAQG